MRIVVVITWSSCSWVIRNVSNSASRKPDKAPLDSSENLENKQKHRTTQNTEFVSNRTSTRAMRDTVRDDRWRRSNATTMQLEVMEEQTTPINDKTKFNTWWLVRFVRTAGGKKSCRMPTLTTLSANVLRNTSLNSNSNDEANKTKNQNCVAFSINNLSSIECNVTLSGGRWTARNCSARSTNQSLSTTTIETNK